jgi:ribosomal protein S18 acetylase RimI-like enzyme
VRPAPRPPPAAHAPPLASVGAAAFGFEISSPQAAERWDARIAQPFVTDPHGGFIAERDGRVVGAAQVLVRERLWVLSLLVVDPHGQSSGAGHQLLAAALRHGARETDAGLIVSSNDPRALRL